MTGILRLLNLRRSEVPRLLHAAAIFFLVSVNDGIVKSVAGAVFNIRRGVEHLPLMYSLIAVLFAVSMALLSWLTAKVPRQRLLVGLLGMAEAVLAINAAALFLFRGQTLAGDSVFYPFLFISSELSRGLTGFQIWIVAGCICYTSRAKVLFPLLASSATLGDIAGGFVVRGLGGFLASYQLYALAVLNLGVVMLLVRSLIRRYFVDQPHVAGGQTATLAENLRYFGRSSYLLLLFVLSLAIFALYTAVHYGFNVVGREQYPTEAGITGLFGLFYGCTGVATLVVTTFLLQRLLRRLGTGNVYLVASAAYAVVGLGLAWLFSGVLTVPAVPAVFTLNLVSFLLLDSVVAPTYQVLIKLVPVRHSDGTRMLMEGGFMLLGGLAGAGLTALHARQILTLGGLFTAVAGLAGVMVVCGWLLRRAYTRVLVQAVRDQDIDLADEQAMISLNRLTARSPELSRSLLGHRDDGVRQLGIEILRANPGPWVEQVCWPLFDHENPRIRATALEALTRGSADDRTVERLLLALDDPDEEVQLRAAQALGRVCVEATEGDARPRIAAGIAGPERVVQAARARLARGGRAALQAEYLLLVEILSPGGAGTEGRRLLTKMLDGDSPEEVVAGIEAAGRLGLPELTGRLVDRLQHPHPAVREAAVGALAGQSDEIAFGALAGALADPDPDVVEAAVAALGRTPEGPRRQELVTGLETAPLKNWTGLLAALIAIDDHRLTPALVASCRARLVEANRYLVAVERLRAASSRPALELLIDQLATHNQIVQGGVVRLLGYLGDVGVVGDLLDRLAGAGEEGRENAVELLENIADRELLGLLLPLLEGDRETRLARAREAGEWEGGQVEQVLVYLLAAPDPWTRTAAVWAAAELGLRRLVEDLRPELPLEVGDALGQTPAEEPVGEPHSGFGRPWCPPASLRSLAASPLDAAPLARLAGGHQDAASLAKAGSPTGSKPGGKAMTAEDQPLTTMEKITFLKESEFFAALPLEELYHVVLSVQEESVRPGTRVIEEGTRGDKMYIVVRGRLEVRKGADQCVAVLREKQVFGDMALLDDQPRSASVVAVEETHLLSLQRSSLERILRRYSSIAFNMMRILSRRLRQAMEA